MEFPPACNAAAWGMETFETFRRRKRFQCLEKAALMVPSAAAKGYGVTRSLEIYG
jgi:hypothetical protein